MHQPVFILESLQYLIPNALAMILAVWAVCAYWDLRHDGRAGVALWVAALASLWNLGAILMRATGQAWVGIVGYEMTTVAGLYGSALSVPLALRQANAHLDVKWLRLILLCPAVVLAVNWSTDIFTLGYRFEPGPPISFAWPIHGRFAAIEHLLGYAGALISVTILAQSWSSTRSRIHRLQSAVITGLIVLPLLGSVLQISQHGQGWTRQISVAGIVLAACSIGLLYLLNRDSHFSLMPVARDVVIESMQDGVLVADASGKTVDVNAAAMGMFESAAETDYLGRNARELLTSLGWKIPQPGEVSTLERNGTALELRVAPVHNHGREIGHAFLIRDITEANRAQTELLQAKAHAEQAAVAKAEFLATMSHEIRTPLNGVLGIAELILGGTLDPALRKRMETLNSSAQSLRGLLDDILDLSRIDSGRLRLEETALSLEEIARDISALFREQASAKGVELRVSHSDVLPACVLGDGLRIRQVLANLVGNAVKFTNKGYVLISLDAHVEEGTDRVWITISVRDSGIGIAQDRIDTLFTRHPQGGASIKRRLSGSGLGLSICKKLVDLMKGKIRVKSQVDVGSEFLIEIPLRLGAPVAKVESKPKTELTRIPARILLAEDNPVSQLVATEILRKLGCAVDLAENGNEAIAMAANNCYDSILMDCQMPELDGWEASATLRQNGLKTPIIAVTASVLPYDRQRCIDAGMNGFIPKPIEAEDLHRELLLHIKVFSPAAEGARARS